MNSMNNVNNTLAHRVFSGRAAFEMSDGRILTRPEHEDLRWDQGAVQVPNPIHVTFNTTEEAASLLEKHLWPQGGAK